MSLIAYEKLTPGQKAALRRIVLVGRSWYSNFRETTLRRLDRGRYIRPDPTYQGYWLPTQWGIDQDKMHRRRKRC